MGFLLVGSLLGFSLSLLLWVMGGFRFVVYSQVAGWVGFFIPGLISISWFFLRLQDLGWIGGFGWGLS